MVQLYTLLCFNITNSFNTVVFATRLNDTNPYTGTQNFDNLGIINIKHPTGSSGGSFPAGGNITVVVNGSIIPYSSSEQTRINNS